MAMGFVRKKKASVMWNRERDVIIVAPEMMPILKVVDETKEEEKSRRKPLVSRRVGSVRVR
jgi:hypothetical protein